MLGHEPREHVGRRPRLAADEDEVRGAGKSAQARHTRQQAIQEVAALLYLTGALGQELRGVEGGVRRGQGHAVDVVRQFRLCDLRRHRRVRERVPEAQPRERHRLAERAQHHQARVIGEQGDGRRPAEVLIGLVHHHQGLRLGEQPLHRPIRERRPRRIVGRVDHDGPRPGVACGARQRVHVELEIGRERHGDVASAVHCGEQAVQAERRHGRDDRRAGAHGDRERRLDELVGAVADEHAVRDPAVSRGEALQQLGRRERRIPVPRGGAHGGEHRLLERIGGVERALVLIQLAGRRRRGERVRRLRADLGLDQGERGFSRGSGGTHAAGRETGKGKRETGNVEAASAGGPTLLPAAPRARAHGMASSGSRQRRARTRAPRCPRRPSR